MHRITDDSFTSFSSTLKNIPIMATAEHVFQQRISLSSIPGTPYITQPAVESVTAPSMKGWAFVSLY
jgi:hypothetical protein